MTKRNLLILITSLLSSHTVFAQSNKIDTMALIWKNIFFENTKTISNEICNGASFDNNFAFLPTIILNPNVIGNNGTVSIIETKYAPCAFELKEEQKNIIKSEPLVINQTLLERGKPINYATILPFKKNSDGSISKLIWFKYSITEKVQNPQKFSNKRINYIDNSLLASGDWYRISVKNSGIFKISYSDLKNWGLNPNDIDPRNIGVFGQSGGMLPEKNSTSRIDDVQELAIKVIGEQDGKFNTDDYILCYLKGPDTWSYDENSNKFFYTKNCYSFTYSYFITIKTGSGKRINNVSELQAPVNNTVTTFNDYATHEIEKYTSLSYTLKSGRRFYGEEYDANTEYSFDFDFPNIVQGSNINISTRVMAYSDFNSSMNFKLNGNNLGTTGFTATHGGFISAYGDENNVTFNASASTDKITIGTLYNKTAANSRAFLDFVTVNARRNLVFSGNQMPFRNTQNIASNTVNEFIIQSNNNADIWNISDLQNISNISHRYENNTMKFIANGSSLVEYIAISGNDFSSPNFEEKIKNQNLHNLQGIDMVVFSHSSFLSAAKRFANYRAQKSNLKILVTTPQEVYNEFSSGTPDVSALRDFMRMLYKKANGNSTEEPKYLLLLGDGSHDNRDILGKGLNKLLTYQSSESNDPIDSYVSDDYFGLLDDNEGEGISGQLDIAVGRMVVNSNEQAEKMIDKVVQYESSSFFGDWKNKILLVGDNGDTNLHSGTSAGAEFIADKIEDQNKLFNLNKLYVDAFEAKTALGERRFPDMNENIKREVDNGLFLINYQGHGGESGWAHERILTIDDINSFNNSALAIFFTATCSFTRWDEPDGISAGELVFTNEHGGAVVMATTTRVVFAHQNTALNEAFFNRLLKYKTYGYKSLGEIFIAAKNDKLLRDANFSYLGDPSLIINLPELSVRTTSINGKIIGGGGNDTLKALGQASIAGVIEKNGVIQTDFNGKISVTIYDKLANLKTLGQDNDSPVLNYKLLKNIVYKGEATVTNGLFSTSFVVPKDIIYTVGNGKISYYAVSNTIDAAGYNDSIKVGDIAKNIVVDTKGPDVKLYMNDEKFVTGGLVNKNPLLIVKLSDENGINTVGSGIGHNITATIVKIGAKKEDAQSIDLNQYYKSEKDNYTKGEVRYPLNNLSEGKYSLRLKAWDVANNSGESSTDFVVGSTDKITLSHVYNYPNPFTTNTNFMFEHNKPNEELLMQLDVYTVSGKLVTTMIKTIPPGGTRVDNIFWNGKDNYEHNIGRGVYVYKIRVRASDGSIAEQIEKLVIL